MEKTKNKAIVLLSGGLDSVTCLALAQKQGFDCFALSFSYGQKHAAEIAASKAIAAEYDIPHRVFELNIGQFGGSALTDNNIRTPDFCGEAVIPSTYVPARNTIFLSIALGYAEVISAYDIFIGVSSVDYSGYPDCRPEFVDAFQHMANLATKTAIEGKPIKIHTPLISLSKAQTIQLGQSLGVDYAKTVSCYRASNTGNACGKCDSCMLRKKGFAAAMMIDPTLYI